MLTAAAKPAEAAFPGTPGDIAFATNRDGSHQIYRMAADGYDPERLTDTAGSNDHPDWSSDGRRIVFVSNRDGDEEVWRMRSAGTNPVNLTDNTAFDFRPSWQPIP